MYTQERIIKELKSLELNNTIDSHKIDCFFHERILFRLKIEPKRKKTKYTLEATVNIASNYEDKDLVEYIADLLTESKDLNYSFFQDKKDTDKEKTIYFYFCSYENILSNFTGEINNYEYRIISNYLNNAIKFVNSLDNSLIDNTVNNNNNNVIYLYK